MEELVIEKLTPHILVKSAKEASALYRELFGAEILADGKIKIGSQIIVITESATSTQPQRPALCLQLDSTDLASSVVKSLRLGCELVQNIVEDVYRPGVLIARISDPFGQIWELADSTGGIGCKGFLNAVDGHLEVLLVGFTSDESDYVKEVFESYQGTPKAVLATIFERAAEEGMTEDDGVVFDTIVFKVDGEEKDTVQRFREKYNYKGTIVGFCESNTAENLMIEFTSAGGDFICVQPSAVAKDFSTDWATVSHVLLSTVKKMYRESLNRTDEYRKQAAMRIEAFKQSKEKQEAGLDKAEITKVTPQLVVRTSQTCQFVEQYGTVFGAQEVKFNVFFGGHTCSELFLDSYRVAVRDDPDDPDLNSLIRVRPQPNLFLELECSDLTTSLNKAREFDWTLLKEEKVEDDPTRVELKDPFGHVWHLCGCPDARISGI